MTEHRPFLMAAQRTCPVTNLNFTPVDASDHADGLLWRCKFTLYGGWIVKADLRRRENDGSPYLAYPRDKANSGRWHSCVFPVRKDVADAVLLQVLHGLKSLNRSVTTGPGGS